MWEERCSSAGLSARTGDSEARWCWFQGSGYHLMQRHIAAWKVTGPGLEPRPFWNCTRCSTIELSGPPGYRNVTGFPIPSRPLNPSHQIICWSAQQHCAARTHNLLQHEKWPDQGSNPDPSGTAPDALPLSYQVLQGIAIWPDSPFCQDIACATQETSISSQAGLCYDYQQVLRTVSGACED